MTAFDHQIVDIEKAGRRVVVGIVENADGPGHIVAIDTDSRESCARRIVERDYDLGQIGNDFRLGLSGLRLRGSNLRVVPIVVSLPSKGTAPQAPMNLTHLGT